VISDTIAYNLAIISFWYRVFWQTTTEGIFSYTKELEGLKDHLQILSYESNGKPSSIPTAPFMYGGVGTGVEHQFFQKIQQVPEKTLSTFVITEKPIDEGHNELHRALNAHALGFSEALATGNQTKEPEAFCEGNQPSLLLVMKKLTPENLGALIAIYEYKTIIESLLYGVNAFEGYGVIPGKNTVQNILQGQLPALQSTIHWVKKWGYFQENKKKSPSE
ncbi:MAG: hypothetical protein JXR30_01575, partial [Alphaproteobacteria bacterium]|nr:hypothetical protein [Alphaproteobacteria bacterium]